VISVLVVVVVIELLEILGLDQLGVVEERFDGGTCWLSLVADSGSELVDIIGDWDTVKSLLVAEIFCKEANNCGVLLPLVAKDIIDLGKKE
jgi:hypothetical protein